MGVLTDDKPKSKRMRFCEEYIRDYNGVAAAIRCGYSPKSANNTATKFKSDPIVLAEIQRLEAERSLRYGMTEERLIHEISKRALVNIADVVDRDGRLRDDINKDDMSTITQLKTRRFPDGTIEQEVRLTESAKYMELLCKVLGHIEQRDNSNKAVRIDAEGNVKCGVIFIPNIDENPSEGGLEASDGEK